MFVAAHGLPLFSEFALVVLAMVFARTAAMTFNRLADWEIDNATRAPPAGTNWSRSVGDRRVSRVGAVVCRNRLDDQFALLCALTRRTPHCLLLFTDKAIYARRPVLLGPGTRSCANWSLDCGHRQFRPAAACPRCLRFVLGGRVRYHLRDAGSRHRST